MAAIHPLLSNGNPVPIQPEWLYEIIGANGDKQAVVFDSPISTDMPVRVFSQASARRLGVRRLFKFEQYIGLFYEIYGYLTAEGTKFPGQISFGPDKFVSNGYWAICFGDNRRFTFRVSFIASENNVTQADGPGLFYTVLQVPTTDLEAKPFYLSREPPFLGGYPTMRLAPPESAPRRDSLWMLRRSRYIPQAPLVVVANVKAVSIARATFNGTESAFCLQLGTEAQRIVMTSRTVQLPWTAGTPFGLQGDVGITGNSNGLFSYDANGNVTYYVNASNVGASTISTSAVKLSTVYGYHSDTTLLGIHHDTALVYQYTGDSTTPWTVVCPGFQASSVVGSSDGVWAVSAATSIYGPIGAIYELSNQSATMIADPSLNPGTLVLTSKFVAMYNADQQLYLYNGTPGSWTNLCLPTIRPWGGATCFMESPQFGFIAMSGDQMEVVKLNPDTLKFTRVLAIPELPGLGRGTLVGVWSEYIFISSSIDNSIFSSWTIM